MYQQFPTPFAAGDTLPIITGQFPFDITGHTIVFRMLRPSTTLQKTATIANAADGTFYVAWDTGDLVAGTSQLCEIRITDPTGHVLTSARFFIDVAPVLF